MPSVPGLDSQLPSRPSAPRAPFPKAHKSFEGVLIAAADLAKKRKGVAAPAPSRASSLRMPSAPLKLTTGTPAASRSDQTTFRPLPLSKGNDTIRIETRKPTTSSAEPRSLEPSSTPAGDILARQVVSDYQEYQRMATEKPSAAPVPSLVPAEGQYIGREIERVPRAPFPRRGEIPPAPPQETAPLASSEARAHKSAVARYKDEQLLANAGGDKYVREAGTVRVDPSYDHSRFTQRVGKDLRDASQNLRDAAGDLSSGTTSYARSASGEIIGRRRPGLFGTIGNFAKDMASGVTLGLYRPGDEPAPKGFGRLLYPFKKIAVDAVFKDLVVGVPSSLLRAGEHTTLAALNTAETIPDATIGHFAKGREITSQAFDTAQVGVSYVADVLPAGEAWSRVGASRRGGKWGIPVVTNLKAPEHDPSDPRFADVRNTTFRKGIETIGTLGAGAILASASAPAAVVGASAAMRAGNDLNARHTTPPPSPVITYSPERERVAQAAVPSPLSGLASAGLQRVALAAEPTTQPVASFDQEAPTSRRRPRLWETY